MTAIRAHWRRLPSEIRGFVWLTAAVTAVTAGLWQVMG